MEKISDLWSTAEKSPEYEIVEEVYYSPLAILPNFSFKDS